MCKDKEYLNTLERKYSSMKDESSEYKKVGWGSVETQTKRFEVLLDIADVSNKKLLDIGCGLGHFVDVLKQKNIQCYYSGIDMLNSMIEMAKKRNPSYQFSVNSIDSLNNEKFDYVFSSGIFTYSNLNDFKYHIKKMYDMANFGVAFNTLSTWGDSIDENEFQADPIATLNYCKTITPYISLRHDYLPHDFTIFMRKQIEN